MIHVEWISPATGERRKLTMTEERAAQRWAAASYPVQCSAHIKEVEDEHS
jgi:hypothetical protein